MAKQKTYTARVKDVSKAPRDDGERSYKFRSISIDKIETQGNIRKVDDIDDLVASIEAHGIIHPITVTSDFGTPSYYRVIAGFRRLAAAKKIGMKNIPCHVIDGDENTAEISLSENVTRMDMTPYEECMAVKHLVSNKNPVQKIAKKFGRTLRWVLVRKKLADAGVKVMKKVMDGQINLSAAAKLADLPDNIFKKEMEDCERTDNYFVNRVLEEYHKDLNRAPFDHSECETCDHCSAAQQDLFDDEKKAYCLNPVCWKLKIHEAAKAKAEELQDKGVNARIGKFNGKDISYNDEAYKYRINSWDSESIKKAKEAGSQKRVLVNPETAETFEYLDKRDLPDYHEETEEEKKENLEKVKTQRAFDFIKRDMYDKRLISKIAEVAQEKRNESALITIMLFCNDCTLTGWFDAAAIKELGIDKTEDYYFDLEDIPEGTTDATIAGVVRSHIRELLEYNVMTGTLEQLYRTIMATPDNDPQKLKPTDEEVEAEIARQNAEKAEKQE